ncbi:MAG: hypothetical protein KME67_03905 [Candidatus Thiodiazotropha sp. (ex Codakia orbicularis)]|nr:hypothetical protein [Candidatus Thiodiazotropha sp. (ex Codakia orbicularis)]
MNAAILLLLGVGWLIMRGRNSEQMGPSESVVEETTGYTFHYLSPEVIPGCWDQMDLAFLIRVDQFMWDSPGEWMVSPAVGAACRDYGSTTSRHYAVGRKADAIDLMLVDGDLEENYRFALTRFGGVGVYPDWIPFHGLHVDGREGERVATWAGIRQGGEQVYVAAEQAFV